MTRDYRKEFRDSALACVSGCGGKSFWVTVNGNRLRCKPNVEGGVNVYIGKAQKPTKALALDEFVEWAEENAQTEAVA